MTYQGGPIRPRNDGYMADFDVEISYGAQWISLNDHLNFRVTADDFGTKAQQLRRITATSPYYDGTYLVHSTKDNVTEAVNVYVYGASQNQVTENLLLLEELYSQASYNMRVSMDDHRETWLCQPADFAIDRTHVMAHNIMAVFKAQIPRSPNVSYEAIL